MLVRDAPPGTTFWLEPGVHRLGRHRYDQVVPKDRMTFIGAPGAAIDGQDRNQYAFSGDAQDVTVEHLTIQDFVAPHNEGVVNHDSGDHWLIRRNTIRRNGGAGVFFGDGTVVAHNCLARNGQYGFSAYESDGVRDVALRHNEIFANNTDNWEVREPGCGCSGGGKFWETRGARVVNNWVHDNRGVGLWADTNNTGFLVRGNFVSRNDSEGLIYETSYNASIVDNTFSRNGLVAGPGCDCFPVAALYLSEAGSDLRAGRRFGDVLNVAGNRFVDNWSGIIAWENADRFAGSPNNTSTGYTTLVNPEVATVEACGNAEKIGTDPYVDDCRWKTQNLRVQHNLFDLQRSRIGAKCTARAGCGYSGLFSNYGTSPDWSPYQGELVQDAITFGQDNVWRNNRYAGPWRFIAFDMGNYLTWREWRRAPYRQDEGSTRR
jgi:hypothetical protein